MSGKKKKKKGKPEISISLINSLKNQGFSEAEIARMLGRTRQAINYHVRKYGGITTPRQDVKHQLPWKLTHEFTKSYQYKRLADHAEYFATTGKGMAEYKLKELRWFYNKLHRENLVVEFDPNIPGTPGSKPGWAYRERLPSDGELIIRVNEYTDINEDNEDIWMFPVEEP